MESAIWIVALAVGLSIGWYVGRRGKSRRDGTSTGGGGRGGLPPSQKED